MWQCKICGKKFNKEPIYCSHCGATENFLIKIDPKDSEDFYKEVENNFRYPVSNKSFNEYDDMIKDFLADEYIPISTKVKEPFEDENRLRAEKKAREEKLKTIDNDYYESIKSVVGTDSIEKEDYYQSLEDLFKDPINAKDETTFNGLFSREDTMENTFLKPKKKEKRVDKGVGKVDKPVKEKKPLSFPGFGVNLRSGNKRDGGEILIDAEKKNSKLTKILVGLLGLFILLVVLMGFLVNHITTSGDETSALPDEAVIMSFFSTIKGMDEATFLSRSSEFVSFVGYEGSVEEKTSQLQELYAMVISEDFNVKGVNDITRKGTNRVLVDFNVTGNKISVDTFDQLLFRTTDNVTYQLDFSDFLAQLTIAKEENAE